MFINEVNLDELIWANQTVNSEKELINKWVDD